jgi:hypothetical protein
MFCLESRPIFFWSRSRSTDRIRLTMMAERLDKPLSAGSITTSRGNCGSENWELMAPESRETSVEMPILPV